MPALRILACLVVASSLGGCERGTQELNTRKGERVIAQWLEKQELAAESVSCPEGIQMQSGESFVCTAIIADSEGLEAKIRVVQKGDEGDVTLSVESPILNMASVERALRGQILDQTGKVVESDCGLQARPVAKGKSFRCAIRSAAEAKGEETPAESFEMEVTFSDDEGHWQAARL